MARQRSPDRDKAFEIYKASKGEKPLVDIAAELNLKPSQIRKWKSQDKWDEKMNGNVTIAKRSVTNVKNPKTKEKLKEILEDEELTEKERLFCLYYVKYFNGTQAALKAGYSKDGAHVQASRLLRRERVSSYIKELKGELVENVFVEAMDVLKEYIKIAFADITNYVTFGQREVELEPEERTTVDEEGKEVTEFITETRMMNFIDLAESDMVDGSIITEVKQGRDGISIKLADKMKALDKLSLYFDLFPDNFKRKVDEERLHMQQEAQKVQIEKTKAEIKRIDDGDDDSTIEITVDYGDDDE
ncbi:terminase small subunit [Bacillus sp. ZZQ-131]|uniref:Terminase small subunit n=2 Tax=root TaxID=1 RepID=A0A0A7AR21_9CAUD|nr:terminase small subunit [Bacillus thuringiensis]YP_009193978.1 terminase small subunit [Bacillus phage vB_BtS_BMBtp3]MDA2112315.1 terminase small subunit [Bacillus cereus]AHC73181.1 phage terminase small subunit [Bacillus thuringiensis serovar tenebrionis str. YBT-1765]AHJ86709.1 terminase small subunit [Bacillus phage vB_BtS_BMBtp3]MDA2129570.1 terminase small subunit [Bacillus cereus]MDA2150416.1 terminase small subunit [Bacillus cereus]